MLVCLCSVSASFIKCSSVYQPLTSKIFVRKTKTKIKIRLSVINVCNHRKKAINLTQKTKSRSRIC
ncbi:hypothetical protein NC652_038956 [Populus alba x Populus x berolinensis]|nr:hypothetical protein NC651_037921 [Populus alba x Populus x berolinensis]KAJ6861983.1 hypothetical protein NC652_038956 [Populus alba x Populus x berolinensis]